MKHKYYNEDFFLLCFFKGGVMRLIVYELIGSLTLRMKMETAQRSFILLWLEVEIWSFLLSIGRVISKFSFVLNIVDKWYGKCNKDLELTVDGFQAFIFAYITILIAFMCDFFPSWLHYKITDIFIDSASIFENF